MMFRSKIRNSLIALNSSITKPNMSARVVALHEVENSSRFQRFLDCIQRQCEIVSLEKALSSLNSGGLSKGRPPLVLSFDDGYLSWATNVLPSLLERNIPATFFITTGLINLTGSEVNAFVRQRLKRTSDLVTLSKERLMELASHKLVEIGSHSVSHPDFTDLSSEQIKYELEDSKIFLEELLGKPVRYFSFPFGQSKHIPAKAVQIARRVGYSAAFSYQTESLDRSTDGFLFGRDGLSLNDSERIWQAWTKGGYDRIYRVKEFLSTFGRRG